MQEENKRLAQQKRDREAQWKQQQAQHDAYELAATVNHGLETESARMTNYLNTCERF